MLPAKDRRILELQQLLCDKDEQITDLQDLLRASDKRLIDLRDLLCAKDERIAELEAAVCCRDAEIQELRSHLDKFLSILPFSAAPPLTPTKPRTRDRAQGISAEPPLQELAPLAVVDKSDRFVLHASGLFNARVYARTAQNIVAILRQYCSNITAILQNVIVMLQILIILLQYSVLYGMCMCTYLSRIHVCVSCARPFSFFILLPPPPPPRAHLALRPCLADPPISRIKTWIFLNIRWMRERARARARLPQLTFLDFDRRVKRDRPSRVRACIYAPSIAGDNKVQCEAK